MSNQDKNYSREIVMPADVAELYKKYCMITKMKLSEPLRVLVLESLPKLHNAEDLGEIVEKAKTKHYSKMVKFYVRLPGAAIDEINIYCKFFNLHWRRCHFLYFLIEKKLLKLLKEVMKDE